MEAEKAVQRAVPNNLCPKESDLLGCLLRTSSNKI